MEFKKTPLQNLKDILEAVDSQASVKKAPTVPESGNSDKFDEIEPQEDKSFEEEWVCRVDHVQKSDILLKIKEIKEFPKEMINSDQAYQILRELWQEGLLESDIV